MGRASARAAAWVIAAIAGLGCAKGSGLDEGIATFGVGSSATTASGTQGMATVTQPSTTSDDEETGATTADDDDDDGPDDVTGTPPPGCGDGTIDADEDCDGTEFGGASCASQGFSGGQIGCTATCVLDTSSCSDACGNSVIDDGEPCDGDALGGADCVTEGFVSGTIACTTDCVLDTSGCVGAACGDGLLQAGESCDCGGAGSPCTPQQLGDQSCTGLPAPSGGNYTGGTLACSTPTSCAFDESGCWACGDGVVNPGEACDGADLGGATCQSQGFDDGTLSCNGCALNAGACIDWVCGNGTCEPNEDTCSCAADCPNDPLSCDSPCECGGNGGGACFCDDACIGYGDCCFNGPC